MKKRILVALSPIVILVLIVTYFLQVETPNTSLVYNNAQERKHSILEKGLLTDNFFVRATLNNDNSEENKLKSIAIDEKEEVPAEFFDRTYSIVFFGDSLTQGVGDRTNNGGYTSYVEEFYRQKSYIENVKSTNLGVRGNRTTHLINRLKDEDVRSSLTDADFIVITIGGNDLMKVIRENFLSLTFPLFDKEQKQYGDRLLTVLENVRSLNESAPIYVIGVFNPFYQFFQEIHEFNEVVTNWNNTTIDVLNNFEHTYFVDIQDVFLQPEEELLYDDQFHPNENGYKLIGERVIDTLENNSVFREDEFERE